MNIPKDLLYAKTHEWVRISGDTARIGITDYAQGAMGDIVFAELPEAGEALKAGSNIGTLESVKAVSDIFSPVDCVVLESNAALEEAPERINQSPYEAFLVRVALNAQPEGLMTAQEYEAFLIAEGHG